MSKLYVIVTVTMVAANVYAAITDLLRPNWVLNNMAGVGVSRPWLPLLATLKGAGAAGLLLGYWDSERPDLSRHRGSCCSSSAQ